MKFNVLYSQLNASALIMVSGHLPVVCTDYHIWPRFHINVLWQDKTFLFHNALRVHSFLLPLDGPLDMRSSFAKHLFYCEILQIASVLIKIAGLKLLHCWYNPKPRATTSNSGRIFSLTAVYYVIVGLYIEAVYRTKSKLCYGRRPGGQ
jgi:hypothetical protein